MREEYLHHAFQLKIFGNSFRTTKGEALEILNFGEYNSNAGPDFLNARIKVEETVWAGSVEFHIKSSDWYAHQHHHDLRYNNVIVHFVLDDDKPVLVKGTPLQTVILKDKIDHQHYLKYVKLTDAAKTISCAAQLKDVPAVFITQQKERALFQRLERKSAQIIADIKKLNGDLETAFYYSLARVFGGKVNAPAFENLMTKISLRSLQKQSENELVVPAVIFGISGLLPSDTDDEYVKSLIQEFQFQKEKILPRSMEKIQFRFSRMHPQGFPTIRLAQLSEIIRSKIPIGDILSGERSFREIQHLFKCELPIYWKTHFTFGKPVKAKSNTLSDDFINLIFINSIVPFIFSVGRLESDEKLKTYALELLTGAERENNSITRFWASIGLDFKTAFDSQALIEQKNEFCSKKKCLACAMGYYLLSSNNKHASEI